MNMATQSFFERHKGEPVRSAEMLAGMARARLSVISRHHPHPIPAAVVLQMQCSQVLNWIDRGLYAYRKEVSPWMTSRRARLPKA